MKHEIELEKLKICFDNVCKKIARKNLKITEFEGYYIIFKEALYSGLFSIDYLKNMANLLLKAKVNIQNKKDKNKLEYYYQELKRIVTFIERSSKSTVEQVDGIGVKKVYKKF